MRLIGYSSDVRRMGLAGLPALIFGILIAAVVGTFVVFASVFGIVIFAVRYALARVLKFFGAEPDTPRVTVVRHGTIEMRRDKTGSWRGE